MELFILIMTKVNKGDLSINNKFYRNKIEFNKV